jgi:hypothetical protein
MGATSSPMRIHKLDEIPASVRGRSPAEQERERALKAARQRRWREHARDGVMMVPVPVDGAGINWLRRDVGVLAEADADDPREIGAAIGRMIKNSARSA